MGSVGDEGPRLVTALLREDSDPMWERLRVLLAERDIDPQQAVLAECFEDDVHLEFCVLVTPDGGVFEFDFVHGRGDIKTQLRTGVIANWERHTDDWRDRPYRSSVEVAFGILDEESAGRRDPKDLTVHVPLVGEEVDRLTERLHTEGWASHVTVDRLLRSWEQLAGEVSDYPATIDDYTNDMTARDALDLLLQWASPELVSVLQDRVSTADRRFVGNTVEDGGAAVGRFFRVGNRDGWWWRRRPATGALSDYLDR